MDSVQNYLGERLSGAQREEFEARLLTDATLLGEFETTLRLREGLATLRDRRQLPPRRDTRTLALPLAACCAGLLIALALIFGLRSREPAFPVMAASLAALHPRSDAAMQVAERHTFAALRGAEMPTVLELPSRGALQLRALTSDTGPGSSYQMRLERNANATPSILSSLSQLMPDADGFVEVYVDAGALTAGDYVLVVRSDRGTRAQFPFKLK